MLSNVQVCKLILIDDTQQRKVPAPNMQTDPVRVHEPDAKPKRPLPRHIHFIETAHPPSSTGDQQNLHICYTLEARGTRSQQTFTLTVTRRTPDRPETIQFDETPPLGLTVNSEATTLTEIASRVASKKRANVSKRIYKLYRFYRRRPPKLLW